MANPRWGGVAIVLGLAALVVIIRLVIPHVIPPPQVPLASIHWETERYVGQRVQVSGTVRAFDDPGGRYYVLEDANQNRILLQTAPANLVSRVDQPLTAIGTVGFDENRGIYLDVETMQTGS